MNQDLDDLFQDCLTKWHRGFVLWSVVFYLLGMITIIVPILISTGMLEESRRLSKYLLAAVSISVSIIGWLKPGTKATAHEHAFLGLRTLAVQYRTGNVNEAVALENYRTLLSVIDYEYVDRTVHR